MDIGPLKSKAGEFAFPQGKHDILPALPIRALALGPGSSGKTNMLVTLITDPRFFRGAWEHIYWCSPTSNVDDSLQPLRDYVRDHLKQDQEEDPTFHDTLDTDFLQKVVARQRRVTEWMKKQKPRPKKGYGCLIVIDDLADANRHADKCGSFVDMLYVKARHWGVSTIVASQKLKLPLISPCLRVNLTCMFVWRLRNQSDLWDGVIHELSAIVSKDRINDVYQDAVSIPYGFLYVNLLAKSIDHMFHSGFNKRYILSGSDE